VNITERFDSKIEKTDGCWIWRGSITRYGYGQFAVTAHKTARAHRFAYELWVGSIPSGLVLDHLCRNRACVHPDHLEPVTHRENLAHAVRSRRPRLTRAKPAAPKGIRTPVKIFSFAPTDLANAANVDAPKRADTWRRIAKK